MGCGLTDEAAGTVLPVSVHTLPSCELPPELLEGEPGCTGDRCSANLELLALGDFAASNDSAEILPINAKGTPLRFPSATAAVEARVARGGASFIGYGARISEHGYDVLLWPELTSCRIFRPDGTQGYPGKHGGQAFGYAASQGVVLAAGGSDASVSDAMFGALSWQVTTGAVASLDTSQDNLLGEARAFATATEFGPGLLVAGGEQPVSGVPSEDLDPRATAEIFDPKLGAFVGEPLTLHYNRTRHAAVRLLDGSTLLVGGRTKTGGHNTGQPVLEVVSPETGLSAPRASLVQERLGAVALLASGGRVFVGGGVTLEGDAAEPAGEWFSADGRKHLGTTEGQLPSKLGRAFVAMPGGGVLAVGGTPPEPMHDVYWIDPEGNATDLEGALAGIAAPEPILLPGSDGSPWLVAALDGAPDVPRLFRFDPWNQRFTLSSAPVDLRLPRSGFPAPIAIDPDAFAWLDEVGERGELLGLRLGTRSRFSQDVALVLRSDPLDPSRPVHLAPDRPLMTMLSDVYTAARLTLDAASGVTVLVTDTDYADVTVTVHVDPSSPALPVVVLGETLLGGKACRWNDSGDADEPPTVVRSGELAELRYRGKSVRCAVAAGRLSLGLRAEGKSAIVTQLDIRRGPADQP